MPQMYFSVDEQTAKQLTDEARAAGVSVSRYIATLVSRALPQRWPTGYLSSVVGACSEWPIDEPDDLPADDVDMA